MTNCQFKYSDHTTCDRPCQVRKFDRENCIIQREKTEKGELKCLRVFNPVLEYEDYCYNHLNMMRGLILPVETRRIPDKTLKKISAARHKINEELLDKKRKTHKFGE